MQFKADSLTWDNLDGLAQRALFWDSGFSLSSTNESVQIFTDGTHSMADLAVPISDFLSAGCSFKNCTQADNTTSYVDLGCTGDKLVSSTRCLIEDFEDDTSETVLRQCGPLVDRQK